MRFGCANTDDPDTSELIGPSENVCEYGKWREVQDFCWLKSTPSPNWCLHSLQQGKLALLEWQKRMNKEGT
ncbi:hypothetical protein COCSUDRAFT_37401 [Coccomyxa subellipsoidea C-169]|uniref:Uncharacterized protein n=1 Tax=Coccomyxa subellipsoidea (strain C-169) TaxID=574566 RepID=I0YTE5_COCSC|nr:hypothetical protein COCSUDRAFT_37401 [Coccomyxa subellipsoidea C-169]EIE21664.1 hypothetical protein COCSUDRAFT_37401 [Coccomyxa subellipsoidea C-169]|eukprot:XP_005646208.1 hypothetical protein COCSUDRAFT_37401 [Coccomyxa subellipsoidea C-169]